MTAMRLIWKNKRNRFRGTAKQPASEPFANRIGKIAVPTEPATFAVTFGYMNVTCNKHHRDVEVAFDMPDEQFGRRFRLSEATVLRLRSNSLKMTLGCALGGAAKVCVLRFFATGSFQSSVRGEETVVVMQPAVSICVRRVSRTIVNSMTRNNRVHLRRTCGRGNRKGGIPSVWISTRRDRMR
ncbi:hypothetical protein MRX96_015553 [Rhipicephalus microplus]